MKYLKKFEAKLKTIQFKDQNSWGSTKKPNELDPEFFKGAFVDFIDEGADYDSNIESGDQEQYFEIFIPLPKEGSVFDLESAIQESNKLLERYKDIKSVVDYIKEELPEIKVTFRIEETGESNAWLDTIEKAVYLYFSY